MTGKFPLGETVITASLARMAAEPAQVEALRALFVRHHAGDWGTLSRSDEAANEAALRDGERILSVYTFLGEKIYIVTEWDRSVTTALLATEY
jgi:hypothetical protein